MKLFNHKTAQMEMIGLVVIVILITLGMLFMAQFALKEQPQKKIFTRKGLAYSSMSAILKTSVKCNANYVQIGEKLLEDCAIYQKSPEDSLHCQPNNASCDFVNGTIADLLSASLGKWNKNYEFISRLIVRGEGEPIVLTHIKNRKGCQFKDRDTSGLFPLQTDAGLVENILYLCD